MFNFFPILLPDQSSGRREGVARHVGILTIPEEDGQKGGGARTQAVSCGQGW